jgi:oligopeptide transport system substrate-binding protein
MTRSLQPLFAIALLIAVVAAVVWSEFRAPPQAGVTLNRGITVEPESLDMLVGYLENGELIATGAARWEISAAGLEYRFFLRPEARWSNGDPVTAADFVYSFRRLVDPQTAAFYAQTLIDVENAEAIIAGESPPDTLGVTAIGEHELLLRLRRPVPYFLDLLSHPSAYPVHPPTVEQHGDAMTRAANFVGNGAYVLSDRVPGALIELSRNPHYRDNARTWFDIVRHHVVVEDTAELARYRSGELDITATVPPDSFAQMRGDRPGELRVAPYLGVYYYGFNLRKAPFKDNPKLRQALSMAIDREELVEKVIGRGEAPAYSWVPPGMSHYEPRRFPYADMPAEERIAEARRLYREAGFSSDNPLQVELRYNTSDLQSRVALAIQSMWRDALGFEATLVNEEFQVLLANIRAGEVTQIFRTAWLGDYGDAHTFLQLLESDSPSNMFGYDNPEYDSLMQRAAGQTDPSRRQLYLEEAERVALSDHAVLPIYFYVSKHMISPRVQGWGDNVLDYHYSQYLSFSE